MSSEGVIDVGYLCLFVMVSLYFECGVVGKPRKCSGKIQALLEVFDVVRSVEGDRSQKMVLCCVLT